MIRIPIFLCLTVLVTGGPALAGQTAPDPAALSLDECLTIALRENPLVQRSREGHRAAVARVSQARAFPQPEFSYDSDLQPRPFHFGGSGESYIGFSQMFEFPGKRSIRGRVAMAEAEEVSADLDLVRLDLGFAVREAFHDLLLAEERLRLAEEDYELAEQFTRKTSDKHAAGDVGRLEVLRSEVEAARAAAAVETARNDVVLGKARLNRLLARPEGSAIAVRGKLAPAPVPADIDLLKAKAEEERPELRRLLFTVNRERLRREQANIAALPDIELGVARHRIVGEVTSWDVTLSVPVPLYFWQPRKGEIAEAEANRAAAEREAEHIRGEIMLEVEVAYRNALAAGERIRRFEQEILPKARESYDMFAFAYEEGEIDGLELITARRTLIEARQEYAESLYDSNIAAAALARALGTPAAGS